MCIICVELEKEKLTLKEAASNYREVETTLEPEHSYDLFEELWNKSVEEGDYEAMRSLMSLPASPLMEFLKRKEQPPTPKSTSKADLHDEYWSQWDENDYFGTD